MPGVIRSKAPLRLGLAGGGSDVPPFVDLYGGAVLSVTVNLYGYCTIRPCSEPLIHIHSADNGFEGSYPAAPALPEDCPAQLIRGVYNRIVRDWGPVPTPGFSIWTSNDAPAGSGLGTSSTMVVTILRAFAAWMHRPLEAYETARLAWEIERIDLALAGGKQDQYAATFGGFNYMEFLPGDGGAKVTPLRVAPRIADELESSLVLYFTGRSRSSAAIIREQQKNTSAGNEVAIGAMHRIRESSAAMTDALLRGDIPALARILGAAWEDKKKMAGAITNPMIQNAFDVAMAAGAVAGKVSGAGGGGFIMLMVPPEKKTAVVTALSRLDGRVVPFEFTRRGVRAWRVQSCLD